MLVVLRGNSGSGKSSTAKRLREAALERSPKQKIALVEQDTFRRIILKEKRGGGAENQELMEQTIQFALDRGYAVILEGIMEGQWYRDFLLRVINKHKPSFVYYFDVSFEECLRRHQSKPNSHEFGEVEMREWFIEKDVLGVDGEQLIPEDMSQEEIVRNILEETSL